MVVAYHTASGRGRLGAVSHLQPVVVDADRHQLELHRPHHQHHLLDHRGGFLRGHRVHGLLRLPLSSQGGKAGSLQSRKQEARMVAHHRDCDRRWSHVGARPVRLAPVRHGSGGRHRDRGHGPAVAMELPPSGQGWPDGHNQCPQHRSRQPHGLESRRSARARRRRHRKWRLAPPGREAGQGFAALRRCPARFLRARVPGQDGYGPRHGHLFLDDPDPNRNVRCSLRRAVWRSARADARQGYRRRRE